jgi:heptaprenyl diphosphate synthase
LESGFDNQGLSMKRYFLIQDPHHDYAVRFIEHIHRKYDYQAICFYSDRRQRIRQAPLFPQLASDCVAANYEVKPHQLAGFADHLRDTYDVAAVIPFNEPTVLAAVELAERLKLGWSQPTVMRRFRDKYALKQYLRSQNSGLRINASRSVGSLADVLAARIDAAYERFILKPNDGYGNRGIALFDRQSSAADIERYLLGMNGSALMEEYIGGTEYFVNGQMDENGRASVIAIFEYQRTAANGRHNIDLETHRVAHGNALFAVLSDYACSVMRTSGLIRSPFHLELKVDAEGPCLIEVGARLPGLGNAFLSGKLHGPQCDWFDIAAHYYLNGDSYGDLPLDWTTYDSIAARYVHGISSKAETVYRLDGVSAVESLPSFNSWVKKPSLGARFGVTVDCLSMPWSLVLTAPSEEQVAAAALAVRRLIQWNQPASVWLRLHAAVSQRLIRYKAGMRVRLQSWSTSTGDEQTALATSENSSKKRSGGLGSRPLRLWDRLSNAVVRQFQLANFGKLTVDSQHKPLTPQNQAAADQAVRWAEEYLAQPHSQLGRKGPICPFVKHTVDIGRYFVSVRDDIDGRSLHKLRRAVLDEAAGFLGRSPNRGSKGAFASVVMVFPAIPEDRLSILEGIHDEMKTPLMERDLMFSAFHQKSEKSSLSNPDFKVFRAPFPALVLRHMDVRDIAFLNSNRKAFLHFRSRFAPLFEQGKVSDEFGYVRMYEEASARYGR